MDLHRIADELRTQLRERPYWTTATLIGVGWILGRSLPLRAVLTVASIGARAAVATVLEDAVAQRLRSRVDPEEGTG